MIPFVQSYHCRTKIRKLMSPMEALRPPLIKFADERIIVNPAEQLVHADDIQLALRPKEYEVLHCLGRYAGCLMSFAQIAGTVWDEPAVTQTAIRLHITYLRKKLTVVSSELGDRKYGAIRTIRGAGYRAVESLNITS